MIRAGLARWLRAPLATGWPALGCAVAALVLATLIRAAVSGVVTGCEFTPYLPFVLACAILLRWWQAGAVALASVAILGGLFVGSPQVFLESPCFLSGAGIFLAASGAMIAAAVLMRGVIGDLQRGGADESSGGIVFSLDKGEVWASWYGRGAPVCLGTQRKVSEMMEDFLAHEELAKRLTDR